MLVIDLPCSKNKFVFQFDTECRIVYEELSNLFYPYVTFADILPAEYDIVFVVKKDSINLFLNGAQIQQCPYSSLLALYKTIVGIIRDNIVLEDDFSLLHGAVLAHGTDAYILLAESQMGKSTLSMYLTTSSEFKCITDDLAIIHNKSYRIYPISKFLHVRKSALVLFDTEKFMDFSYNPLLDRYQHSLSNDRFSTEYVTKKIVILDRQNSINRISKLHFPCNEIVQNSYLPFQLKSNIVNSIILSQHIETWKIEYSTLQQAHQYIKQISSNNTNYD